MHLQKPESEQIHRSYVIHEGLERRSFLTTKFPFYTAFLLPNFIMSMLYSLKLKTVF